MVLSAEHIYKYFNGEPLIKDINLTIEDRETIGLIGTNGCGKTTLLNILTGNEDFDKTADGSGAVSVSRNINIGFMRQNSGLESSDTVDEEMHKAFSSLLDIKAKMKELEHQMSSTQGDELEFIGQEYSQLSAYFEARDGYNIDVKINQVLNGMGFQNISRSREVSSFSGGEKTRLALAKLLLEEPDLLILDEPTNHLDFDTLIWLEDYLKSYKGAILIVSHDRYFLNKICTRICEIENGRLTSYKGGYSAYLVQKDMNNERQMKEYQQQQKEISKLEDYITKNKVRASTAKMAKSRQHALDKIERTEKPVTYTKPPKIKLEYTIEPTKEILQVKNCDVTVGNGIETKTLIDSLNFTVRRGEHVAIIGPNGIGKTSILKMIQNIIPHNHGNIIWGDNIKISYFDQEHANLNTCNTVFDEVSDCYPRLDQTEIRRALGSVLITGEDVFKPISVLSGGERAKLCFCLMALNNGNVLILDEPTNHIDLNTKEVLEDSLAEFEGTIILVSHDRYLINKVANRIISVTKEEVKTYKGNFDSYLNQINAEKQMQDELQNQINDAKAKEEYNRKKQNQYRSKEQRAKDAARRNRIKELEKEIEQLEIDIFNIENEIATPEIASDFELMSEKCSKLEDMRTALDEKMDEWAELDQ